MGLVHRRFKAKASGRFSESEESWLESEFGPKKRGKSNPAVVCFPAKQRTPTQSSESCSRSSRAVAVSYTHLRAHET